MPHWEEFWRQIAARAPRQATMPAEAQNWMLSLVFGALGLALGSIISSTYPTLFAFLKAPRPLSTLKHALGCTRNASTSRQRKLDVAHDCLDDRIKAENHGLGGPGSEVHAHVSISNGLSEEITSSNGNLKPDPFDPSKRQGYLTWDDYFMAVAFLSAHRSKDPNRQVGACLVSQDRVILGIGYNGFPRGCSDDALPWAKMSVDGDPLLTKYPYVCHAEVNAILNKNHASAHGQRLYVTMFPCNECAKVIIQTGVAEVVYFIDKGSSSDCLYSASRKLLCMAGVKVWKHQPAQQKVVLEFK